ncbi:dihydrolipoyl dehydrogenase [Vagococcus sp. BWB3-3]|uniref:Dihydrolipoyl dehydrogenase n=1 Tax=Vagococcus allomyrinae TaxID=2794353 RepID=A0A940SQP7_9ENTE|nr:dihydrolipoyl dehydrogenase [Vagococcus allomyrinae]MBP1039942.1 dihydrolipoyl dehydrogenase [Vagococcus allomyrinae]
MTVEKIETLIIGSGPGGYVAAIRGAQLGQQVVIVEAQEIGGVCLNVGCIPSKALITAGHRYSESLNSGFLGLKTTVELDFSQTQQWKDQQVVKTLTSGISALLKKNKVRIVKGTARFTGRQEVTVTGDQSHVFQFEQGIIATGSRPVEIPGFPFGSRILDSTGGLNLSQVPERLVIIGGGVIGSELGGAYANLGAEVTILEGGPQLLPSFEADVVKPVESAFKAKGVTIVTNALATKVVETEQGVTVSYTVNSQNTTVSADYVMVTVGRRPNTDQLGLEKVGIKLDSKGLIPVDQEYRTSNEHVFAIGDVIAGPALAHKASYDAKIVAEVISGQKVQKDYRVIPAICFTDPEIATVGLTLSEAEAQQKQVNVATFPLQANGRALSLNATTGFVRLVVAADQQILGAQIVGVGASELIAELTLAIESSLTVEDIALTIHGHPTLSETIMDATELALGLPIHM